MSNKLLTLVGIFLVGLGALAATTQGCGGGSSSPGDLTSLCNQGCMTTVKCTAGFVTMDECVKTCTAQASCSNVSAIIAGGQKCLGISDCAMAQTCATTNIPDCIPGSGGSTGSAGHTATTGGGGSTGSAGSHVTGGAGSTGSGGMTGGGGVFGGGGIFGSGGNFGIAGIGGSTCATACVKADSCCNALPGAQASNCTFKADCDAASAADMANQVMSCNALLQTAAILGANEPAACK